MPQQPREASLLTSYADIHYYFTSPTSKPPHHRFDKGSYVYLYHHLLHHRAKLECANHAGTPDQDAFTGYLDGSLVEYNYKHSTLFTITVDGGVSNVVPSQDTSQWHLPAYNERNETKYMYRLHTVDIYFWTVEDAATFLHGLQQVLQPHQLRIQGAPPSRAEHQDPMSPVVQKLEKAAITTKIAERSSSISTTYSSATGPTFSGPPTARTPSSAGVGAEAPAGYAPMAYNPAAPAAPEPIAHREKTPPPVDAETGTGLQHAATHNQGFQSPYGQPHYQQQPQGYFPGQPGIQITNTSGTLPPPPPQPSAGPYTPGFASNSSLSTPSGNPNAHFMPQSQSQPQPGIQRQQSIPTPGYGFSGPPQSHSAQSTPQAQAQYANYPRSPSFAPPPVASPSFAPPSFGSPPPGVQQTVHTGPPPQAGYSSYQYNQPGSSTQGQAEGYSVHGQIYRPSEAELSHGAKPPKEPAQQGRLEQKAGKFEKKVGGFLKRLDNKF